MGARFNDRKTTLFKKSYELENKFGAVLEVKIQVGGVLHCYQSAGWATRHEPSTVQVQGTGDFMTHNEAIRASSSVPAHDNPYTQRASPEQKTETTIRNLDLPNDVPRERQDSAAEPNPAATSLNWVNIPEAEGSSPPISRPSVFGHQEIAINSDREDLGHRMLRTPSRGSSSRCSSPRSFDQTHIKSPPLPTIPTQQSTPPRSRSYCPSPQRDSDGNGAFDHKTSPRPQKRLHDYLLGVKNADSEPSDDWCFLPSGIGSSKKRRTSLALRAEDESAPYVQRLLSFSQCVPPPPSLISPLRSTSRQSY